MRSVHRKLGAPSFLANIRTNLALLFRNPFEHKSRPRRPESTPASLLSPASYLSRTVMAVSWILRFDVRQIHSEE
jgi:hypothetical protein